MASQNNKLPSRGIAGLLSNQRGSISVLTALTMVPFVAEVSARGDLARFLQRCA